MKPDERPRPSRESPEDLPFITPHLASSACLLALGAGHCACVYARLARACALNAACGMLCICCVSAVHSYSTYSHETWLDHMCPPQISGVVVCARPQHRRSSLWSGRAKRSKLKDEQQPKRRRRTNQPGTSRACGFGGTAPRRRAGGARGRCSARNAEGGAVGQGGERPAARRQRVRLRL